ncbi:MAG: tetratricopeptide repeat protein [Kiritimatiellae bacterium]|jgi:TolA-binding protein|nr:tetratricopeptide repeat protein [Kiritimatiellia bacterium]
MLRKFLLCFVLLLIFAGDVTFAQSTPREVRLEAADRMQKGLYMDAIPPFMQLIEWYKDETEPRIITSMEMVYYNISICYFLTGQFDLSEKAFREYLKRYPHGFKTHDATVYIADCLRFREKHKKAIAAYEAADRRYSYTPNMQADIYSGIARSYLAEDNWADVIEPLKMVYINANDFLRKNWAATLLATAYLKELDLDNLYPLTPYILTRNSFASRSVAFNMAALEAADQLFGEERYKDALWVYRMVYPYDLIFVKTEEFLEFLNKRVDILRKINVRDPRTLIRLQETIGEVEAQLEALDEIDNYDKDLLFRIARGYMEMMRYREAGELFYYLHGITEGREADEALYTAFQCATMTPPWTKAYRIGREYMETYPGGEFFDPLTIMMGQLYAKEKNWPMVISHLTETLQINPQHSSGAECKFLLGYASFMEEQLKESIKWLTEMLRDYPKTELREPATYWIAMGYLFDGDYKNAASFFDIVLDNYPGNIYAEDGAYRRAVCSYGLSELEDSDKRLAAFVSQYPKNENVCEAILTRGDIAGAEGRLDEAVVYYDQSTTFTNLNIELYNHASFQAGKILVESEKYQETIDHYKKYIKRNREGSNIPLAVYWIGYSLWNGGQQGYAMKYYLTAVEQFGNKPDAIGVDMILDEWIGRAKRSDKDTSDLAWNELRDTYVDAVKRDEKTLTLRLKRTMLYNTNLSTNNRARIMKSMRDENSLQYASPAVCQFMLDTAVEDGDTPLAVKISNNIIDKFTETDYALDARMVLADNYIAQAQNTTETRKANELYDKAEEHLNIIREVYATSGEASQALIKLGWLYLSKGQYEESDECFKQVLGVKAWKPNWPEALYGRGECSFEQNEFTKASAYYERIYIMYSRYIDWVAKAYYKRAVCLQKMYQPDKAKEVIDEMLSNPETAATPEADEARELLKKLR